MIKLIANSHWFKKYMTNGDRYLVPLIKVTYLQGVVAYFNRIQPFPLFETVTKIADWEGGDYETGGIAHHGPCKLKLAMELELAHLNGIGLVKERLVAWINETSESLYVQEDTKTFHELRAACNFLLRDEDAN